MPAATKVTAPLQPGFVSLIQSPIAYANFGLIYIQWKQQPGVDGIRVDQGGACSRRFD